MRIHKLISGDTKGCINLGKQCADYSFIIDHETEKVVLDERQWLRFQEIMETDEEPTDHLSLLMKDSES